MKNSTLLFSFGCSGILNYISHVEENGLKRDFSRKNHLQNGRNSFEEISKKKYILSNFLILVLLFLFTNFLYAQQPACNLKGILESKKSNDGGRDFTITPDTHNATPGTIYKWEFISNTSGATFISESNSPTLKVKPGDINGEMNIRLTLINPASPNRTRKSCSCTKSISIGNL